MRRKPNNISSRVTSDLYSKFQKIMKSRHLKSKTETLEYIITHEGTTPKEFLIYLGCEHREVCLEDDNCYICHKDDDKHPMEKGRGRKIEREVCQAHGLLQLIEVPLKTLKKLEEETSERKAELSSVKNQIETTKKEEKQIKEQIKVQIEEAKKIGESLNIEKIQSELDSVKKEIEPLKEAKLELESKVKNYEKELSEVNQKLVALQTDNEFLTSPNNPVIEEKQYLKVKDAENQKKVEKLTNRINELEKLLKVESEEKGAIVSSIRKMLRDFKNFMPSTKECETCTSVYVWIEYMKNVQKSIDNLEGYLNTLVS